MAENKTKIKSSKRPVIPKTLEKFPDFPKQKVDQSDSDFKSEIVQYWKKKKKEKHIKAMRQFQRNKRIDRQTKTLQEQFRCCFPNNGEDRSFESHFLHLPGLIFEVKILRLTIMKELKHVCTNNPSNNEITLKSKEEFNRAIVSIFSEIRKFENMHDLKTLNFTKAIFSQPITAQLLKNSVKYKREARSHHLS